MDEPLNTRIIRHAIYLLARSKGLISATEAEAPITRSFLDEFFRVLLDSMGNGYILTLDN